MAHQRPLPPRNLSWLFVAITLALATALVWLGIALLRQDQALEAQRVRDDLQRVALKAGNELSRRVDEVERALSHLMALTPETRDTAMRRLGESLGDGAVLIDASVQRFRAAPAASLQYDPSFFGTTTSSTIDYAHAESLEFRVNDPGAAEQEYRRLSMSTNYQVAAGAVLRLGRVLQKQRKLEQALSTFRQLGRLHLDFDGVPAALLAGHATIALLEDLGRTAEANAEATSLAERMNAREWRLSRSAYEFYAAELGRRSGATFVRHDAEILSRVADSLYHSWPAAPFGRTIVRVDSTPVLVVWGSGPAVRVAFLATPEHTGRQWVSGLDSTLRGEGATISLAEPGGQWIVAPADASVPRVTRSGAESGLPWILGVQSVDPAAQSADLAVRRRILFSGLVVAMLIALVGTYAVARAVNRELAAARMQSDFVSAVSHEFRTPLTSLRQVSELLAAGRVSSEERRTEYHDVLQRETNRLQRLVENLLDFGRFEAGAHEFRFERVAPREIVEPVVSEFREDVRRRGFDVVLQAAETGDVSVDREAMALALRNLLDNAVKYSRTERRIDIGLSQPNGRVALTVRDRGIGIPAEEHEAIFDRFTRGSGVVTSGIPGTGIGLAMVRHIVTAHGGEIQVTSVPGEGSTFTILLNPLAT